jgi:hypothetical protein
MIAAEVCGDPQSKVNQKVMMPIIPESPERSCTISKLVLLVDQI